MITLANALVESLKALGIGQVFGVSGANFEHFHDGIARRGSGRIAAVLAKSEIGVSFMADGLARGTGALAACCATSGGGMMNLAVGLAESFASQIPVLAVIGQAPDTLNGRGAFQDSSGVGGSVDAAILFAAISRHVAHPLSSPIQIRGHDEARCLNIVSIRVYPKKARSILIRVQNVCRLTAAITRLGQG